MQWWGPQLCRSKAGECLQVLLIIAVVLGFVEANGQLRIHCKILVVTRMLGQTEVGAVNGLQKN